MTDLVPVRIRTLPLSAPKEHIAPLPVWPACAVVYEAALDHYGGPLAAWVLELFLGRVRRELAIRTTTELGHAVAACAGRHSEKVLAGCDDRIAVLGVETQKLDGGGWDGQGYRVRERSYRGGDALVVCGIGRQVASMANRWVPSRSHPGYFTLYLDGLAKPDGTPFSDSGGITVRRAGDRYVATWSGGLWDPPKNASRDTDAIPRRAGRWMPRRGPIVDVLSVAGALRGVVVDALEPACRLFDVSQPAVTGDAIVDLRARAHAIAELYWREVLEARGMGLSLNLAFLVSPGGIMTAIFREAGL
jgi:hypothetical protein